MSKLIDKVFNTVFFILLVFMAVFSTVLMPIKIILILFLLVLIVVSSLLRGKVSYNKGIVIWMTVFLFINLLSMLYGKILGNAAALNNYNTELLEPIIFFAIIIFMNENNIEAFFKLLRVLLTIICIYNLLYFCVLNGLLPGNSEWFIGNYPNEGGLSIGFTKFHSNNIPWLIFLVPMEISRLLIGREKGKASYILVLLGMLNALLSMRSVFILTVAITPFITLLFCKLAKVSYNKKHFHIMIGLMLLLLFTLFVFSSSRISNMIRGAVDKVTLSFSTKENDVDAGGYMRIEQIKDLLATWKEKPLLGWGASANAKHIIRSDVPGTYEMQYFAMLMQRGLIGFGIYMILHIWLFSSNIKDIRENRDILINSIYVLVGFFCILVANATNPYLGSFDRLILLFIPLLSHKANILRKVIPYA